MLGDRRSRSLFTRNYEKYTFSSKDKLSESLVPKNLRRRNASFIAAAKQTEYSGFDDFLSCIKCMSNVTLIGRLDPPENDFKLLYEDDELRDAVTAILRECDTGIDSLKIDKVDVQESPVIKQIMAVQQELLKRTGGSTNTTTDEMEWYSAHAIHQIDGVRF